MSEEDFCETCGGERVLLDLTVEPPCEVQCPDCSAQLPPR